MISRRKDAEKAKTRQNGISQPKKPLVDALNEKREEVIDFLRKHNDLLPLLQEPELVSVIDTGASQRPGNTGEYASRSRKGTDTSELSVYSFDKEECFYMWLFRGDKKRKTNQR